MSDQGEYHIWQERAPHGPLFVHTPSGNDIFFGGDEASAKQCLEEFQSLRAQLASARKALEGVYYHMDRNGMANWPVAKRVRKELDSLTDENGK